MWLLLLVSYLNIKGGISSDHIYQDKLLYCIHSLASYWILKDKRMFSICNVFKLMQKYVHLIILFFTEGIVYCSKLQNINIFQIIFKLKYVCTVQCTLYQTKFAK